MSPFPCLLCPHLRMGGFGGDEATYQRPLEQMLQQEKAFSYVPPTRKRRRWVVVRLDVVAEIMVDDHAGLIAAVSVESTPCRSRPPS